MADLKYESKGTYHVTEDETNGPPVLEGHHESLPLAQSGVTIRACRNAAFLQSCNCNGSLAVSKSLGVGREIEEEEARADGPSNGSGAFHNEQPSPATDAMSTIQATGNGTRKETTESARQDSCGDVDCKPLRLLFALVPRGEQKKNAWGETSLEDTDEDSQNDEVFEVLDGSHHAG